MANSKQRSVRSNYWQRRINPVPKYKARKRRIIHKPLVLSGYGIKLKVNQSTLLIMCGFTHYPQKQEEYNSFPQDCQLPPRFVILDGDGSITLNALEWLQAQGVPLVQINWCGEVKSVGGIAYSSNANVIKWQIEYQTNSVGFDFSKWLLQKK